VKSSDISRARIPGTKLEGWRAIAVGILALYVLLFIVLNNHKLDLNFVFFKIHSHELLALIVIMLVGFAAGFIVGGRRQKAHSDAEVGSATDPPDSRS
jgi:uncharacterized integral membrane protein